MGDLIWAHDYWVAGGYPVLGIYVRLETIDEGPNEELNHLIIWDIQAQKIRKYECVSQFRMVQKVKEDGEPTKNPVA